MKEVRELMKEHKALVLKELQKAFKMQVRSRDKPFKQIPHVCTWKVQYLMAERRYKFLVLHGGSLFGKTAFAMNLFGEQCTFYVGMQGKSEPDLREFDAIHHKAIVMDEMSMKKVIEYKRLMQAPDEPLKLGTSTTNMYAYDCWLGGKAIIVTSNKFKAELQGLDEEDKAWVESNCVAFEVTEKLYED